MLSPCKDCKRRKVGCHNVKTCAKWAAYVEAKQKEKAARIEMRERLDDFEYHQNRHGRKRPQR